MPHGDVEGEAAEGLAQRGEESSLVLPARWSVALGRVALGRGTHQASPRWKTCTVDVK